MKLHHWVRLALMSSGIVVLAACSSAHKKDASAVNDANAAYESQAQASGLGEESGMSDEDGGRDAVHKRVYYFDYDSNIVNDSDLPAISANANYLMSHPNAKIILEGHTDPRGSREYNIGLGERRAKAVAQILTSKGVNSSQIRVVSYGAEKLAAPGRSEADFRRDRRVVLAYIRS